LKEFKLEGGSQAWKEGERGPSGEVAHGWGDKLEYRGSGGKGGK